VTSHPPPRAAGTGWQLQLRDSELAGAAWRAPGELVLRLSAAWLSDGVRSGPAAGVSLLLAGVVRPDGTAAAGALDDLLGTVRDGHWRRGAQRAGWLPLNQRLAGPLQLVLGLGHHTEWQADAASLLCQGPHEPQLGEWLHC
jgi:hypothetical protein